jgi:hypothetical protein
LLLQPEVHRNRGLNFRRLSIYKAGTVTPLLHGFNRGIIEHGSATLWQKTREVSTG